MDLLSIQANFSAFKFIVGDLNHNHLSLWATF